ncbi:MAG: flavodoxin family protein [Clostridiales Family XIII bacterium]|jgi:multimeric flavodoxin WrbA|nr:flavodoxin family protein [Clostridiales Family XIII bacterium]
MNIIGFNGSPRKSGNTAWAIGKILEGAIAGGADARLFQAGETEIKPCRGCLACVGGDGCVMKDGMQEIYSALKTADALILGAPIYMGQMCGQAKVFTDRLFAQIKPRFSPTFKEENAGKSLILVWTQGNPDSEKFKAYLDYTKMMFEMLEFKVREAVVVAGTRTAQASEQDGLEKKLMEVGTGLAAAP